MKEIKTKKQGIVNEKTLIVSVDMGKTINTGYYRCPDGTEVEPFEFFNNGRGFGKFWQCIASASNRHNLTDIVVGFESTGPYAQPLIQYLRKRDVKLVQVNPMHTKRLKEVEDNSPNKTDKKDPKVIANIMELGRVLTLVVPQGASADLRHLTCARERQIKMRTELMNQLHSLVAVMFPEFFCVMKDISAKSSQFLLKDYNKPADIVNLGADTLTCILKKISRGKLGKERAEELYEASVESVGVREGETSIIFEIRSIIAMIEQCNVHIREIEQRMRDYLKEIPYSQYILSIKGIGEVTCAGLIGEVGDFRQFKTIAEIQKLAGLNLFEISSGKHRGERHISKRGRSLLRKILFFAAINAVRKGGILHCQYQRHLECGMLKMKALVAIARQLLRIIFALVREHSFYISDYRQENRSLLAQGV